MANDLASRPLIRGGRGADMTGIFLGKSGEFATSRCDQQELGMVALHIL